MIKERLHQYIDLADDKKLKAIYTILQNEIEHSSRYTAEELDSFYKRREHYLNEDPTVLSAEESHNRIRKAKK